ncbi:unnamed protein product [Heligmosomoides polygyrus]|uniref:Nudix hydrolase domain-containing protein n=1 Tax=Heligmosomoides polygyrus TaxID=6339 RepID=A0A3P8B8Q3_HELPZ|nr:unnamed protein product [Heligmosomoides polygyrus]
MAFKESTDVFGGITVRSRDLSPDQKQLDAFSSLITQSLEDWKKRRVRGVWMRVDIQDSHIIPALVERGFMFHHTQPHCLVMTKWLPETPCTLPIYAHTLIGAGGIVVDSQDRVLMMRENRGHYLGWKFPGGASDPGENIFETATREVFEETGVKTVAKAVLCFRQLQRSQFENVGDIYFLCVMEALNVELKPCPSETAECRWLTREEINSFPDTMIRDFHLEMLSRYDKWKSSGRPGCHSVSCNLSGKNCMMFYVD